MSTLHDFGFVAFDLKYTRPDDTGSYTCKASNSLGEAVISANLVVTKLLRITKDILSHLRLR
jgi:titin